MSNIITIDGPASSGKSSVGHLFSKKIGFQHIDSGVIYRCFTYYAMQNNLLEKNEDELAEIFDRLKIEIKKDKVFLNGTDVTEKIHDPAVSKTIPPIAALIKVRIIAEKIQRKLGFSQNTVMAGRDIGSVIFPDSKLKFYITASVEVRSKRRFEQLKKKMVNITFEEVLADTKKRDQQDSERKASPLVIPNGATIIDTTNKTIDESVEIMMDHFRQVFENNQ